MRFSHIIFCLGLLLTASRAALAAEADFDKDKLDCLIEPYLVVNVGSEIPGVIETVNVDRGDFVKKGQVLARLNSGVEQATMENVRARLDFATHEHARTSEMYKEGIMRFYDMDKAETNLLVVKSELKEAQEVLERRTIRSPINGVVVERFLAAGERVEEKPLLKLAQLDPLNVEVIAPVTMLGSIKVGRRVEVRPEKPLKGVYIGRVKIVDRVLDAASGTFGIRIELANTNYTLPAGLKCSVRFLGH